MEEEKKKKKTPMGADRMSWVGEMTADDRQWIPLAIKRQDDEETVGRAIKTDILSNSEKHSAVQSTSILPISTTKKK